MKTEMQRRLGLMGLGMSLMGTVSIANAGPDISLYGVADVYVALQKGDRTETSIDSGGLLGSRFGVNASAELSPGLKAVAKFEAGIATDAGVSNQGGRVWGRQTWVGLDGEFGTVTLGRQYTPTFNALDDFDPFETGAGSAVSSGIVTTVGGTRADNSINWDSKKFGGLSVSAMYAAGENHAAGSNSNNSLFAASGRYADGPLSLGLTAARLNRATDAGQAETSVLATGMYDFGLASISGGVQTVRHSTQGASANDDRTEYFAGVHVPVGSDKIWAGIGSGSTHHVDGSRATQLSLGYLHSLAKNTVLYGVVTNIHNSSAAAYTTDTATGSGAEVSAGTRANALQAGIYYRF